MVENFFGYCPSCAFAGLKAPNVCALAGWHIEPKDHCSKHRRSVPKCSICGGYIISDAVLDDGHLVCPNCISISKSCKICRFCNTCEYETNPSPLEKTIQREIRNGNSVFVTQGMNPERVRITCEKGCKCYDPQKGCLRQNNSCPNYEIHYND